MTERQRILRETEKFVSEVISKDLKQTVDPKMVHQVAIKVSRVIPTSTKKPREIA